MKQIRYFLLCLTLALSLLPLQLFGGANYFVSPTGNTGNSGLDQSHPWPLAYALNGGFIGPGVTLNLMDGLYNAGLQTSYGPNGQFQFNDIGLQGASAPLTIRAINKWKAIIAFGTTGGIGAATHKSGSTDYTTPNVIFDGLQICSNTIDGLTICSNSVVRNCWVHDNTQQGVNSSNGNCRNNLFEFNLFERNGLDGSWTPGPNIYHYHNVYVYGANNTFRFNVSRLCVYGHGVQFYSETDSLTDETNNWIYGNLVYSNCVPAPSGLRYGTDIYGASWNGTGTGRNPGINYAFCNAFLDGVYTAYGTLCFTNNILTPPVAGQPVWDGVGPSGGSSGIVVGDYNAGTVTVLGSAHERIATFSNLGFVNVGNGLYWIAAASQLRGAANANIYPTNDWWGNSLSGVVDIGPFQYSATLAADTRNLATGTGDDYWVNIFDPVISAGPTNLTVSCGATATFYATASSRNSYSISYQWYKNGVSIGGATGSSYTTPATDATYNGATYYVICTDTAGSLQSVTATLTVTGCGTVPTTKTYGGTGTHGTGTH